MSLRSLELEILQQLRDEAGNQDIRLKDIMEWSTGEVKAEAGETLFYLPDLLVHVSVKLPAQKVRPTKHAPDGGTSPAKTGKPKRKNPIKRLILNRRR